LRFKEFGSQQRDFYNKYSFSDIFLFSTGKNIKQSEASPDFEIPCVRYGELYHMYNEVITEVINKTNLDKSELLFSEGNEIILPSAGEDPLDIGSASALTIKGVAIGRTINILKPLKSNLYSQIYAAYYINHKLRIPISTLAKGISISNVYNSDLKKLEIVLPNLSEQNKVAKFLFLIDKRIQTQSKIIEVLQVLKATISKKIFSQEIRFAEFNNKWEIVTLGDIGTFFSGGTPLTSIKEYYNGNIPFIKSGEINAINTEQYISEEGLNNSSAKKIEVGDLIYALYGATSGEVAVSKINGAINQAVLCIRTSMDNNFLCNYLKLQKEKITNTYLQGGQGNLSAEIIKSLKIPMPSKEEQLKISYLLSAIDQKIELEIRIVRKLNQQKQYLLKNLFI